MRKTDKITFLNESGLTLAGRLDQPEVDIKSYAIFAHCFGCTKDVLAIARISRSLTNAGIAVLRFDFTGLGNSAGQFSETTFSSNISDLVYAAKYLREHHKPPRLLIGHSFGGASVIAAAPLIPEIKAVATIGAPSNPAHVSHLFDSHIEKIHQHGEATIQIAGKSLEISKKFLDDIHEHNIEGIVKNLNKALIIFHAPSDEVVSVEHAKILYQAARHPKNFISIDQGNHMLTRPQDAEFVANVLGAWAKRYIEE